MVRPPLVCMEILMTPTTLLFLALLGCGSSDPAPPTEAAPAPTATAPTNAHAATGVVPGSHDDWCGEHAVAESQCTRCDASLVPAFQATGDWCPEHGLPESQCLQCNPEVKIERPPKEG